MHPDKYKQTKSFDHKAIAFSVARVPNSMRLFLGCSDFKVYEVDLAAMKPEAKELYGHQSYVTGVTLAGKSLVSGSYDGKLTWFDIESKKIVRTVDAHTKWIRRVFASPDGKTLVSVADDMIARLWDSASGKKLFDLIGHGVKTPNGFNSMLYTAAFSPDGNLVATGDKIGKVMLWEVKTGKKIGELDAPVFYTWDAAQRLHSIGGIRALAFSPDGKCLAIGGIGKIGNIDHLEGKARVEVFDMTEKKRMWEYQSDKFQGIVNDLIFAPDNAWLLASGGAGEGFALFLDVANKKAIRQEKLPMHTHSLSLDEKGEVIIAAGHHKVVVWEGKA